MMNGERVTKALGVPTVWLGLLNHLDATGQRLETVQRPGGREGRPARAR